MAEGIQKLLSTRGRFKAQADYQGRQRENQFEASPNGIRWADIGTNFECFGARRRKI